MSGCDSVWLRVATTFPTMSCGGASIHGEQWHRGVLDALTRAAKQAHLIAYQKGTGVVTRRDGKLVVVAPDPAMYKDLIPPPFVESPQS